MRGGVKWNRVICRLWRRGHEAWIHEVTLCMIIVFISLAQEKRCIYCFDRR